MRSRPIISCVFFLFILTLVTVSPVLGRQTWYVNDNSRGGNGESWASAFRTIQEAIDAADPAWMKCFAPEDTILVKQGTYDLTTQIDVDKVVSIYGGFPDSIASPDMDDRDSSRYRTYVDGQGSVRCMWVHRMCTIDGFYFYNGKAVNGAGIYLEDGVYDCTGSLLGWISPRISNCYFWNNRSTGSGGAMYIKDSDPKILDCTFNYNHSATGGGIYHTTSSPLIDKCTFVNNRSTSPGSLGGGAIAGFRHNDAITGNVVRINNSKFYGNYAGSWGGAISYNMVYPTIKNCTFTDNEADIAGGAFHGNSYSEAPKMFNSICWGNVPDEIDLVTNSTYLNISNCDIEGGWTGTGSNNINGDPMFAGASDFRLLPGSPCIDSGNNGTATSKDFNGTTRPLDGDNNGTATADMGCYEMLYSNVDLRVRSITTVPVIPQLGETVTVEVLVKNYGTTDAGVFRVDWYADEASKPGVGNYGERYIYFSSLAAGASVTMTRTYVYGTPGAYKMYAQVDTSNGVLETNETNNVYGPRSIRIADGVPIDFAIGAEEHTSSMWFGGDDGATKRNVGAGQSITPVRDARVNRVGFQFSRRFDYPNNPEGVGHSVILMTYVRKSNGTIIYSSGRGLSASFNGGWVMFTFSNLWLDAGETYIFTCHLLNGETNELNSGVYAHKSNPWPTSQGYHASVKGVPADMVSWSNWNTHSWDFNFRMEGQYIEKYPGDINDDRSVGLGDVQWLADYWLADYCLMPDWCERSDINWDSSVQLQDFSTVGKYWGATYYEYEDLNEAAIESLYGTMSASSISGSDGVEFKPGTYFIYRTNVGRYGKFIVEDVDTDHDLTIGWVTYNPSGSVHSIGTGLEIRHTYACDLDIGVESSSGSEFWWKIQNSTTRYLNPENGAKFRLMYRAP